MKLKDNSKLNFLIGVFESYDTDITGGLLVLHKLAYELAESGHNVYIFTKPEYPHENIEYINTNIIRENGKTYHQWEGFEYPINKTVSIYSQITIGNPFQTKHVVRWILFDTDKEIEKTWDYKDEIFNFGDFDYFGMRQQKKLTIFDYNFDNLYNENNHRTKPFCYINHKKTPEKYIEIVNFFGADDITFWKSTRMDMQILRKLFNEYKYFLTFDDKSFFTTAAAMCGCTPIILNTLNYTNSVEYRLKNPIQMFGVAYGLDDIEWALKTKKLVKNNLKYLEEIDKKTVKEFINFWENKLLIN